ncbi:unnamed protein product [Cladocopium goreaui]|uniref:Glutathione S-transferase omega-1 n=1 Tax=Cladocopium goreaui TaxID=2562237 RepID=A0A9P1CW46_9DINO|nr:unnamed protein product [Cladocopium goreaui]
MARLQHLLYGFDTGGVPAVSSFEEAAAAAAPATPGAKAGEQSVNLSQNVGCAPGFRCMSLTSEFGIEHNGEYKRVPTPQLPPRFDQRPVWEWGCPARGTMTAQGKCKPPKPGEEADAGMCWSQDSMIAGPKTPCGSDGDKCMCVKLVASDGSVGYGNKSREILPEYTEGDSGDYGGVEVVMGNFQVQPMPHCDDCLALSAHWDDCGQCANCIYGTKVLDGRPTLACYDKNFQPPQQPTPTEEPPKDDYQEKDHILLKGQEPIEQDLWVIPQYPLWDPQPPGVEQEAPTSGQIFPFQMSTEPLSNEAWVKAYKAAAPRIQSLMDDIASKLKTWGPGAPQTKCSGALEERVLKANTARHMCKDMQTLQATLAPGRLGAFPRKLETGQKLRCMSTKKDECSRLNCYGKSDDFTQAVAAMKKRDAACRQEMQGKTTKDLKKGKPQNAAGSAAGGMTVKDLMKEEEAPLVPEEPKEEPKAVQQAMPLVTGLVQYSRRKDRRLGDFLCDVWAR